MITKPFVCVLLLLCAGATTAATAKDVDCLQLEQGWIRLPPTAAMPMAAGFGQLHNGCAAPVVLVSARSNGFKDVSLHETTQLDGVSRMREVEQLTLAVGQTLELKPGGLHLMLMGAAATLQEGQRIPLTLTLADGRAVLGDLQVRKSAP